MNSKMDDESTMVSFKLINNGSNVIHDAGLILKDPKLTVDFPEISPRSSAEVKKVGPFSSRIGCQDIRGMLSISGSSVPVKITLPVSCSFYPLNELTDDDIPKMLSSQSWSSHSVRIPLPLLLDHNQVVTSLQKFLKAGPVSNDESIESSRILASQSDAGVRILFLLKLGSKDINVDVKATDKVMGKAVVSDLKRITLE